MLIAEFTDAAAVRLAFYLFWTPPIVIGSLFGVARVILLRRSPRLGGFLAACGPLPVLLFGSGQIENAIYLPVIAFAAGAALLGIAWWKRERQG